MKARFFSSMLAAFMLATASVGGITASAAERLLPERMRLKLLRGR